MAIAQDGTTAQQYRPSGLDNIIMKDCDFHLLTNLTPDMLSKYTDMANQAACDTLGTDDSLLAVPPSAVFNPKTNSGQKGLKGLPTHNDHYDGSYIVDTSHICNQLYTSSFTNHPNDVSHNTEGFVYKDRAIEMFDKNICDQNSLKYNHHIVNDASTNDLANNSLPILDNQQQSSLSTSS